MFEKGHGLDFYIDGCRYLPDNVSVTKVVLRIYNINFEEQFKPLACAADVNSRCYSPTFSFRKELRSPTHFDPTCIAFISIETIDKSSDQTRTVGYAAISLFLDRFTLDQPSK